MRWSGYTATEVANLLDMAASGVSDRLRGETSWRAEELAVLAELFEVDVGDFYRTPEEIQAGRGTGAQLIEARYTRLSARLLAVEQALAEKAGEAPAASRPDRAAAPAQRGGSTSRASGRASVGGKVPAKKAKTGATRSASNRPSGKA